MQTVDVQTGAALRGGAVDDILSGTVIIIVLILTNIAAVIPQRNNVEVCGGDVEGRIALIPGDGQSLQENL